MSASKGEQESGDGAVSFLPPDVLSSQRKTNKCDKVLTENCVNMSEINKLLFNEEGSNMDPVFYLNIKWNGLTYP